MKGIIRKTREEITIVSYGGGIDRSETLDYVSYIDSHGEEHPREKMNLYWDIEVIDDRQKLAIQQLKNSKDAVRLTEETARRTFQKEELAALNIYSSIINGVFAKTGSNHWSPDEIAELAARFTSTFMERFIKEETK